MKISLIKKIKKNKAKVSIAKNSHYIFIDGKGNYREWFNDICYARFKSEFGIKRARMFINQHKRFVGQDRKNMIKWVDWVVTKSPWKSAFLNSKGNYMQEGLAINCKLPSTFLVAAMTAVREGWEYNKHLPTLFSLVDKGISHELAHIVVSNVDGGNCVAEYRHGHGVFNNEIAKETIHNYKNCIYKPRYKEPIAKQALSYFGINSMFNNGREEYVSSEFIKGLKKFQKVIGKGWDVKHKIDLTDEAVITYLKEWDNA